MQACMPHIPLDTCSTSTPHTDTRRGGHTLAFLQSNAERAPCAVPRHSGRATKNPQNSQTVGRNTALPLPSTQKRSAWLASKKQSSLSAVLQHRYCCTFMYWSQPHQSKSKGPGVLSDSLLPSSLDYKPAHNTGNTAAQIPAVFRTYLTRARSRLPGAVDTAGALTTNKLHGTITTLTSGATSPTQLYFLPDRDRSGCMKSGLR
jgi:hypothetical protein